MPYTDRRGNDNRRRAPVTPRIGTSPGLVAPHLQPPGADALSDAFLRTGDPAPTYDRKLPARAPKDGSGALEIPSRLQDLAANAMPGRRARRAPCSDPYRNDAKWTQRDVHMPATSF